MVPEWKPPTDAPCWLEFCKAYPQSMSSHMSGHPSVMEDHQTCLPLLYKIFGFLQTSHMKEKILENSFISNNIPNCTVTFNTHNAPWAQSFPNNHRVEYTIETQVEKPQAADKFSLNETFLVMRHTSGTKKALSLVTNSPTTLVSKTIKISLWLTELIGSDGCTKYQYYCPGTACFTGQSIGAKFNPWVAFPNYVKELTNPKFTKEELHIKYNKLFNQLKSYMETINEEKKIWALSLPAL